MNLQDKFKSMLTAEYLDTDDFVEECDKIVFDTLKYKHIAQSVQIAKNIERELSKLNNSGISTDNLLLKVSVSNNLLPEKKLYKFSIFPNGNPLAPSITGNVASFIISDSMLDFMNKEYTNIRITKTEISLKSAFQNVLSIMLSPELKSFYELVMLDNSLETKSGSSNLTKTKV